MNHSGQDDVVGYMEVFPDEPTKEVLMQIYDRVIETENSISGSIKIKKGTSGS